MSATSPPFQRGRRALLALLYVFLADWIASAWVGFQLVSLLQLELGGARENVLTAHGGYRLVDIFLRRPWVERETVHALFLYGGLLLFALRPALEGAYVVVARRERNMRIRPALLIATNLLMWALQALLLGFFVLLVTLLEKDIAATPSPGRYLGLLGTPFAIAAIILMVWRDHMYVHLAQLPFVAALQASIRGCARATIYVRWLVRAALGMALVTCVALAPLSAGPLLVLRVLALAARALLRGSWLDAIPSTTRGTEPV
jgi:hypothetical protein